MARQSLHLIIEANALTSSGDDQDEGAPGPAIGDRDASDSQLHNTNPD